MIFILPQISFFLLFIIHLTHTQMKNILHGKTNKIG